LSRSKASAIPAITANRLLVSCCYVLKNITAFMWCSRLCCIQQIPPESQ
jgi:hypothetical protein